MSCRKIWTERAFARAVREEFKPADFSVVVKRRGSPPKPWRWEIYCACKAVPIERSPVFFDSAAAAAKEGKRPSHTCWRDDAGVLRPMPGNLRHRPRRVRSARLVQKAEERSRQSKHLIEFRRDRPEAVFLFAQLAQSRQFSCGRICPLLE